jgi:hypothetical protein
VEELHPPKRPLARSSLDHLAGTGREQRRLGFLALLDPPAHPTRLAELAFANKDGN